MTNSLKLLSKRRKYEYINRVVYPVYVVLVGRDKDKGKIINDIFFIFYLNFLNDKEKKLKLSIYKKYNFLKLDNLDTHLF